MEVGVFGQAMENVQKVAGVANKQGVVFVLVQPPRMVAKHVLEGIQRQEIVGKMLVQVFSVIA